MRLFDVTSSGNLTLENLTLSGALPRGSPAAMRLMGRAAASAGWERAIFNQGSADDPRPAP